MLLCMCAGHGVQSVGDLMHPDRLRGCVLMRVCMYNVLQKVNYYCLYRANLEKIWNPGNSPLCEGHVLPSAGVPMHSGGLRHCVSLCAYMHKGPCEEGIFITLCIADGGNYKTRGVCIVSDAALEMTMLRLRTTPYTGYSHMLMGEIPKQLSPVS